MIKRQVSSSTLTAPHGQSVLYNLYSGGLAIFVQLCSVISARLWKLQNAWRSNVFDKHQGLDMTLCACEEKFYIAI
jgi:hypothetical protein